MDQLNLAVGSVTIGLVFGNKIKFRQFEEYFRGYCNSNETDITIKLNFTERRGCTEVPDSLFLSKTASTKEFSAGNGLIRGKYNFKKDVWNFSVHNIIVEEDYTRVFEQILYQAYNSVSKHNDSYLIHSCGIIKDNRGYLFVGPPESGKSTIAQLSRNLHVINDEINLVDLRKGNPILTGTPFNGLYRDKRPGQAPLEGIFILNQAPFHGVDRISGGRAIKPLAKEIVPRIGLNELLTSATYIDMIDSATKLFEHVPLYRLDFLPDPGFWEKIDDVQK